MAWKSRYAKNVGKTFKLKCLSLEYILDKRLARFADPTLERRRRQSPGRRLVKIADDIKEKPLGEVGKLAVRGPTSCRNLADKRQADTGRSMP
jgi:hypothetical protein